MAQTKLKCATSGDRAETIRQMICMKNEGKTYQVIADAFGVSKQRVYQLIGSGDVRFFRHISTKSCIYKGIRNWMNDNKISMAEFVRRLYGNYTPRNQANTIRRLSGRVDAQKRHIDKILEVTGLTYEVAFELEENI